MGTGQMLITVGAIMLLGTVILTTNRNIQDSSEVLLKTAYGIEGTSIASSTIDEAEYLPFDSATANTNGQAVQYVAINNPSQLTPPGLLGWEGGGDDTLPDDFDDFNGPPGGLGRTDTIFDSTGVYVRRTTVCYVSQADLQTRSLTQTWFKRLDVRVWNTMDPADTIRMSAIYSYWYFR